MKKAELMQAYEEAKKEGIIDSITLFIHMPTGETETITNPNVEEKLKYVEKTYNDDLVHANCKDIYIEDVYFLTASDGFDFGTAINLLKEGNKIARKGWNGKGQYVRLVDPYNDKAFQVFEKEELDGTLYPYFALKNAQNGFVPWVPSIGDLLAEDWMFTE